MGDGNTVTCTQRGTPYADSFGKRSSPIAATPIPGRHLHGAGDLLLAGDLGRIGQSGTIPLDFTRTAVITMGEAQVLIR